MVKKFLFLLLLNGFLFANSCYSILTKTGLFTPVYPYNFKNNVNYIEPQCNIIKGIITFDNNEAYVGCYKTYQKAYNVLNNLKFNFRDAKIVKHKITLKDKYVIFPINSNVKIKNIDKLLKKYKPKKLLKKFPKHFYGTGIAFENISKFALIPTINAYEFYRYYKKHKLNAKILVLYNGVYSFEYLYKYIHNDKVIKKINNHTYFLKYPIYISPTATLVIKNKNILLETKPRPIFIMYHGKLYASNSKFITWNVNKNRYAKREKIPKDKILLIGMQTPRPYFLAFSGSYTYFINNEFSGLGFHSNLSTFGIAMVKFPSDINLNTKYFYAYLFKKKPKGYLVSNTIHDNMMGFYCGNSDDVVLIGNLMYNNLISNIDLHDYSYNLIIARNITLNAKYAHGIVTSRSVNNSIITQNISLNNNAAGIIINRSSNNNLIYDNLTAMNKFMGISIQESDNTLIYKNKIIGNKNDGIIVRNSLKQTIFDNLIEYNLKNGVEIMTKNIDFMSYRDFKRNPYHKATSAVIKNNKIIKNVLYGISVKNNAAVLLKNNLMENQKNYGGDLNIFIPKIRKHNIFKLYGIGYPFKAVSSDIREFGFNTLKTMLNIYVDLSRVNDYVANIVSYLYLKYNKYNLAKLNYIRSISLLNSDSMYLYGFFLLGEVKNKNDELLALSYIAQSVIFGNKDAAINLYLLKYIKNISRNDINTAFEMAVNRIKNLKLVKDDYNVSCKLNKKNKLLINNIYNTFLYKYNLSNSKDYYEYVLKIYEKSFIFTPKVVKQINEFFYKKNKHKINYQKTFNVIYKKILNNTQCYKIWGRWLKNNSENMAYYYYKNNKKILNEINIYLNKYLDKVNEYRIKKVNQQLIKKLIGIK